MNIKQFAKERDEALLSLDKEKIIKYMKKYGVNPIENELIFWTGVHKAILALKSTTEEQKVKSSKWLLENGFEAEWR